MIDESDRIMRRSPDMLAHNTAGVILGAALNAGDDNAKEAARAILDGVAAALTKTFSVEFAYHLMQRRVDALGASVPAVDLNFEPRGNQP